MQLLEQVVRELATDKFGWLPSSMRSSKQFVQFASLTCCTSSSSDKRPPSLEKYLILRLPTYRCFVCISDKQRNWGRKYWPFFWQRYYIWKTKQAEAQSEIWTDPNGYYFLNIMVVYPGYQGKGIGKLLASEVTRKADAEGRKCYLESSRDVPNMKIYEAMGFHFVKGMDCDDEGEVCKLFCMVRDPQKVPWGCWTNVSRARFS